MALLVLGVQIMVTIMDNMGSGAYGNLMVFAFWALIDIYIYMLELKVVKSRHMTQSCAPAKASSG